MNRIRKISNSYQVLLTPNISVSPDSSLILGNWTDPELRNFKVLSFDTLNDALAEAYKYTDINWQKLVINHEHIFNRLDKQIREILSENEFNVTVHSKLMNANEFKETMFERVLRGGERFNLRENFNDLISFTIIGPFTATLNKISSKLENHKNHYYRDDLRLREKQVIDEKITCLYGYTEFKTMYQVKLIPSLLHSWGQWKNNKIGPYANDSHSIKVYKDMLKKQEMLDSGTVLV